MTVLVMLTWSDGGFAGCDGGGVSGDDDCGDQGSGCDSGGGDGCSGGGRYAVDGDDDGEVWRCFATYCGDHGNCVVTVAMGLLMVMSVILTGVQVCAVNPAVVFKQNAYMLFYKREKRGSINPSLPTPSPTKSNGENELKKSTDGDELHISSTSMYHQQNQHHHHLLAVMWSKGSNDGNDEGGGGDACGGDCYTLSHHHQQQLLSGVASGATQDAEHRAFYTETEDGNISTIIIKIDLPLLVCHQNHEVLFWLTFVQLSPEQADLSISGSGVIDLNVPPLYHLKVLIITTQPPHHHLISINVLFL